MRRFCQRTLGPLLLLLVIGAAHGRCETFRVATYNLEGYLDTPSQGRPAKSEPAKAKVRESLRALHPDVLALQEMGSVRALLQLRDSLKAEGLDLPYWEHVSGFDTNIHVAVLSRFPITARRSQTNQTFLLGGRRFGVSRGFGEVDIQVSTNYSFTLLVAHFKSRRPVAQADEADLRLEEAKLLRQEIDRVLATDPAANLVVLGDLNDSPDSPSTRTVLGRGRARLVDTRPAESSGEGTSATPGVDPAARRITWTHFYSRDDSYTRIDYLLLSPGMAREWVPGQSCVLRLPGWGLASDHRPLVAAFETEDK